MLKTVDQGIKARTKTITALQYIDCTSVVNCNYSGQGSSTEWTLFHFSCAW